VSKLTVKLTDEAGSSQTEKLRARAEAIRDHRAGGREPE
jgi:hypothetical protein